MFAPAKTARLFASDVLAWLTVREFAVVNCCIDLTVIDWPLDVSFRTKRCKCVKLESDKNWFGASCVLLRMYDIYRWFTR